LNFESWRGLVSSPRSDQGYVGSYRWLIIVIKQIHMHLGMMWILKGMKAFRRTKNTFTAFSALQSILERLHFLISLFILILWDKVLHQKKHRVFKLSGPLAAVIID
jgi:hypothetical protein